MLKPGGTEVAACGSTLGIHEVARVRQGRNVGIRIDPSVMCSDRLQKLARSVALAPKQPEDGTLGVTFPVVDDFGEDAAIVGAMAGYVAARQIGLHRDAADFESPHAVEVQQEALSRIGKRLGLPGW